MIVVSGLMRSGTTCLARMIGERLGVPVAQEPYNDGWGSHGDYGEMPADLAAQVEATAHLRHRYWGWHVEPAQGADLAALVALYRAGETAYPGVGVLKVMTLPWWGAMLEAWGLCEWLGCDMGPQDGWTRIPERSWDGCAWGPGDVAWAAR